MAGKKQPTLKFVKGYGNNFRKLRTDKKLTLPQLAEKIFISDKSITAIENEIRTPTVEQLNIYIDFFDCSLDYLTGRTSAPELANSEISKQTGLNSDSINVLSHISNTKYLPCGIGELHNSEESRLEFMNIVNDFISSEKFIEMLEKMYLTKKYMKEEKKSLPEDETERNRLLHNVNDLKNFGVYTINLDSLVDLLKKQTENYFLEILEDIVSGKVNKSELTKTHAEYVSDKQQDINKFFNRP